MKEKIVIGQKSEFNIQLLMKWINVDMKSR